jgi:membrane fusion protein, heavy metal efflux system
LSDNGEFALRAPVAGVVTERVINPGTQVGPDTTKPLFVISDPAQLWVSVDLPEHNLGVLKTGQTVTVEVDAFPDKTFEATIVNVGDVLDAATRRVQVRAALDNPGRLLKPEMYARVTPLAASGAKLVRVPNAALVTVGVTSYGFVEREPGVLERRKVVTAMQGREFTYLRDGIVPGERIVVSGALLLNSELQGN